MSAPFITERAASAPVCTPRGNMTCGHCKADLCDCSCPRHPECILCEMSPEDADFVDPCSCVDSNDGKHHFIDRRSP